jgi:hypothetical protein
LRHFCIFQKVNNRPKVENSTNPATLAFITLSLSHSGSPYLENGDKGRVHLLEGDAQVDVDHLGRVLVQQDVLHVPVTWVQCYVKTIF